MSSNSHYFSSQPIPEVANTWLMRSSEMHKGSVLLLDQDCCQQSSSGGGWEMMIVCRTFIALAQLWRHTSSINLTTFTTSSRRNVRNSNLSALQFHAQKNTPTRLRTASEKNSPVVAQISSPLFFQKKKASPSAWNARGPTLSRIYSKRIRQTSNISRFLRQTVMKRPFSSKPDRMEKPNWRRLCAGSTVGYCLSSRCPISTD